MEDQVTLEAYADENRALIHNDRNDEAIAVCKHILHYYPKHVDSYRQLGEAYLEQGMLEDAKDMFRRVLSADPENVVAHVGLATVFEQQHIIDETVWHLERAYELAPGNLEIHKELLRVSSEAGKPRQRLKLTPAGLARLYVQEGLYAQAIQELRAIVAESPSRFDARVALAETLWRVGRIRESADVAQSLLSPLPYCLKANLILGTAWKESGLPDSQVYLDRAQELDPTNKVAARLLGEHSPLAPAEISVPRYVEGAAPPPRISPRPAPAFEPTTEPSEPIAEESEAEPIELVAESPAAETSPPATEPPAEFEIEAEPTAKPDLPVANLPSWLADYPEGTDQTTPSPMVEERPEEGIAPAVFASAEGEAVGTAPETADAELPEWLRKSTLTEPTAEEAKPQAEETPTWMEGPGETAESVPTQEDQVEATVAGDQEQMPAWLRELQKQVAPAEEEAPAPPEEPVSAEEYAAPSFMAQESQEDTAAEEERGDQDILEAPQEFAEEMPSVPSTVPSAPPIVVEMPSAQPSVSKRKRQPKGYAHLVQAREHRDANRIGDALLEYDWLVQHAPRLVKDVIDDLELLTSREETPLEAHRVLGDAYTRADRLAEALDRYQFVLERTTESSSPESPTSNL